MYYQKNVINYTSCYNNIATILEFFFKLNTYLPRKTNIVIEQQKYYVLYILYYTKL